MKHERNSATLWESKFSLYVVEMTRKIYNIRVLGDRKLRNSAFDAYLDGYASSLDIYPSCDHPAAKRPVNSLWDDFVRVSGDLNRATIRKLPTRNDR